MVICALSSGIRRSLFLKLVVHHLREVARIHSNNLSLSADNIHRGNGVNVVGPYRGDFHPNVVSLVPSLTR